MNKSATSKELLFDKVKRIAYSEGIEKLNIRRVASETGIAIGTVYNYYPSKSEMIVDVIEDFWRRIFHESSFDADSDDFLASIHDIYARLNENLGLFEQEFLNDMVKLSQDDQMRRKQSEFVYLEHMKQGLLLILERDTKVRPDVWTESFTKERLVMLVFANMDFFLKKQLNKTGNGDETEFGFFEEVIQRLIF